MAVEPDTIQIETLRPFLPSEGEIAVVGFRRDPDTHAVQDAWHAWLRLTQPGDIIERIAGAVTALSLRGATDFYWTPAAFQFDPGVPKRRYAPLAHAWRCYYVDLDCHGEEGDYATPREAAEHLLTVCGDVGLWPTALIYTGRGVQAIWATSRDMSPNRWSMLAEDIWSILSHYGVRMDPTCRRDRARVIRLPGTPNSVSGTDARVIYQGEVYAGRSLFEQIDTVCAERGIQPAVEPQETVSRAVAAGAVYDCDQNRIRLRALLSAIPPSFTGRTPRDGTQVMGAKAGYERWRDVVWAAKRTGLSNAWEAVHAWAHGAAKEYDDLDEALLRTWDSDNEDASNAIGPGTLVVTARQFCRGKDASALNAFHFLSREDALMLEPRSLPDTPDEYVDCFGHAVLQEPDYDIDEDGDAADTSDGGNPDALSGADPTRMRYGGRIGFMPPGYFRHDGGRHGFYVQYKVKVPGTDEDAVEPKYISHRDIEVVDLIVETDMRGEEHSYSVTLHVYEAGSITHRQQYFIADAVLSNPQAWQQKLASMRLQEPMGMPIATWSRLMARYITAQREAMIADGKGSYMVRQLGWRPDHSMVYGGKVISKIRDYNVALTPDLAREPGIIGYGKLGGTLEGQRALLDLYSVGGNRTPQACVALILGSILSPLTPHQCGVMFMYDDGTGHGKSFVQTAANGLFGDPTMLAVNGSGTLRSFEKMMAQRNSFPLLIDELQAGQRRGDPRNEAIRDMFLHQTQGRERSRVSKDGLRVATGDMMWTGAMCVSSNVMPTHIIQDTGNSTRAVFARTLAISFENKPRRFAEGALVEGDIPGVAVRKHYGHIGWQFVRHAVAERDAIQEWLGRKYTELMVASGGEEYRFHNSSIACGLYALKWLNEARHIDNWDLDEVEQFMPTLAHALDDEVKEVRANDIEEVLTSFLQKYSDATLVATGGPGSHVQVPERPDMRAGVMIRVERAAGTAYLSLTALKQHVSQCGVAWSRFLAWITERYGPAVAVQDKVDMTAGVTGMVMTRQRIRTIRIPAEAVVTPAEPSPLTDSIRGKVIRMHG